MIAGSKSIATADDGRKALNKVVPAVVVLRTTACRAFYTESVGASYATGSIVDKRRGNILTNRHVVKPGPVVAEAMFLNREEVPVHPIYRDPVSCVESMLPYRTAIAAALMTSMLSVSPRSYGWLPEDCNDDV